MTVVAATALIGVPCLLAFARGRFDWLDCFAVPSGIVRPGIDSNVGDCGKVLIETIWRVSRTCLGIHADDDRRSWCGGRAEGTSSIIKRRYL